MSASKHCGCVIHVYVHLDNHFHLIATPLKADSLSRMMQYVEARYVRYFNDRYNRTGTLWEGRFGSTVIESGRYFFTCSRYVELNPVRALLAEHPAAYRWSSFHSNAMGAPDPLVTPHELYDSLASDAQTRRIAYRSLFAAHLDAEVCTKIRKATLQRRILGSADFEAHVASCLNRRVKPASHGGARRSRQHCAPLDPQAVQFASGDSSLTNQDAGPPERDALPRNGMRLPTLRSRS